MKKSSKKVNLRTIYRGVCDHQDIPCPTLNAQIKRQRLPSPEYIMINGVLTRREDVLRED